MPAHVACQVSRNEVGNGKSLFFYWRKHLHRTWFVSWNSPENRMTCLFFRRKKHPKLHHRTSGRTFTGPCWKGHDSGLCIELLGVKWAGFSSAISACEKNGHWQIALKILTESLSSKRSATVIGWTFFFVKSSSHCKDLHFWIWRLGYLTYMWFFHSWWNPKNDHFQIRNLTVWPPSLGFSGVSNLGSWLVDEKKAMVVIRPTRLHPQQVFGGRDKIVRKYEKIAWENCVFFHSLLRTSNVKLLDPIDFSNHHESSWFGDSVKTDHPGLESPQKKRAPKE